MSKTIEYQRICNVCGKIFCYTNKEVRYDRGLTIGLIIRWINSILNGSRIENEIVNNAIYAKPWVNFNKCPSCGSTNTRELLPSDKIDKIEAKKSLTKSTIQISSNASAEALTKRACIYIEDAEWDKAEAYIDYILDIIPEDPKIYILKLMVINRVKSQKELYLLDDILEQPEFEKAIRYSQGQYKEYLLKIQSHILEKRRAEKVKELLRIMDEAESSDAIRQAIDELRNFSGGEYESQLYSGEKRYSEVLQREMNDEYEKEENRKLYRKPWFLVLMCLFITPVGVALLWIAERPKNVVGRIVLSICLMLWYATEVWSLI